MIRGGFSAKLQEIRQNLGSGDSLYRDNLKYTARELDEGLAERDSNVSQYLIVGYTLQEEDPIFLHNQTFSRYSENELVGEKQPKNEHIINWEDCRTPILVVSPIKQNTGTSVRHFGLVKPKDGLCQPVLLTHERIFYRWEFRASAGAKPAQRNKNWNSLVVQKAFVLTPPNKLVRAEETHATSSLKRKRSRVKVKQEAEYDHIPEAREPDDMDGECLELMLDFDALLRPAPSAQNNYIFNEMMHGGTISHVKIVLDPATRDIVTNIRASRTEGVLQQARAILTTEMPRELSEAEAMALHNFGVQGSTVDIEDAQAIVNEIVALWPKLAFLANVGKIRYMKRIMNKCGLSVSLQLMDSFIPCALSLVPSDLSVAEDVLSRKLLDLHQTSLTLYNAHVGVAHNRQYFGNDAVFLIALLKEIVSYAQWQEMTANRIMVPSTLIGRTFDYKVSFDINAVRQQLGEVLAELNLCTKDKGCGMADIILWMERLRLLIRQA